MKYDMNKDALIELRDAVKGGGEDIGIFAKAFPVGCARNTWAHDAYNGSLDAAKKLHEVALPDWHIIIYGNTNFSVTVQSVNDRWKKYSHTDKTPARAWLIAILSALISEHTA